MFKCYFNKEPFAKTSSPFVHALYSVIEHVLPTLHKSSWRALPRPGQPSVPTASLWKAVPHGHPIKQQNYSESGTVPDGSFKNPSQHPNYTFTMKAFGGRRDDLSLMSAFHLFHPNYCYKFPLLWESQKEWISNMLKKYETL